MFSPACIASDYFKETALDNNVICNHWITSVADMPHISAQDRIMGLLNTGWYLFGDNTGGRKEIKAHDRICFYAKRTGIVAEAVTASKAEYSVPGDLHEYSLGKYSWAFKVESPRFFFEQPIIIDSNIRARLEIFKDRDLSNPRSWVWLVQGTHRLSQHDFRLLTTGIPR
jgi:hypothetical protein